jgi:outer membrane protein OmpA-like peptidoglycan-associated protein
VRRCAALVFFAVLIAGCAKQAESTGGVASSPASEQASVAPGASETASAPAATTASGATATPEPTPTPDTNLLDWQNGTIVRRYPAAAANDPSTFARDGVRMPSDSTDPIVITYELPGPAAIGAFSADLPVAASGKNASVAFAVGTNGPAGDFHNVGTLSGGADDATKTLAAGVTARWIRITATGPPFNGIAAIGTVTPLPASASPAGIYVEANDDNAPYANGSFTNRSSESDPWYRRIATVGTAMSGARCNGSQAVQGYPGVLDGRVWRFTESGQPRQAVVNDDASLILIDEGAPLYLMRVATQPKFCAAQTTGTGAHRVLVLEGISVLPLWPVDQAALPGNSYIRMHASMLDRAALVQPETAILNGLCDASRYLSRGQTDVLLQWVSAGHELLIVDSDGCPSSTYDFLPYPFTTSNPGAQGAPGARLIVVENDALGTRETSDAHFFDPKTFLNNGNNELGDANIVTTQDSHWCGHLFGTNVKHDNGFMQMYATYGQGVIIYDGFDHDDGGNTGYQRVRTLELQLPVPAGMPCTQSVAASFIVQPTTEATFTIGKAQTLPFSMEALAGLGWSGHLTMASSGDFPATVTPNAFDLAGTTQPLAIAVNVPASAKAGVYTVKVAGSDAQGHTSQATITLTATAPLKKTTIAKHQRIRVYGIHFDYDSAHIQPRSEPVIAQIAALMHANPSWHVEVSGHTDSDGGPAYNLALSQRRAQAVVDDLVAHYGIARSHLVAKGYGQTRPVASNATDAGKALNRRVELERLQ